jgi:hypothetical protein
LGPPFHGVPFLLLGVLFLLLGVLFLLPGFFLLQGVIVVAAPLHPPPQCYYDLDEGFLRCRSRMVFTSFFIFLAFASPSISSEDFDQILTSTCSLPPPTTTTTKIRPRT